MPPEPGVVIRYLCGPCFYSKVSHFYTNGGANHPRDPYTLYPKIHMSAKVKGQSNEACADTVSRGCPGVPFAPFDLG